MDDDRIQESLQRPDDPGAWPVRDPRHFTRVRAAQFLTHVELALILADDFVAVRLVKPDGAGIGLQYGEHDAGIPSQGSCGLHCINQPVAISAAPQRSRDDHPVAPEQPVALVSERRVARRLAIDLQHDDVALIAQSAGDLRGGRIGECLDAQAGERSPVADPDAAKPCGVRISPGHRGTPLPRDAHAMEQNNSPGHSMDIDVKEIPLHEIPDTVEQLYRESSGSACRSYFCAPDWISAVAAFTDPGSALGLVVRRGHHPIGLLPLELRRNRLAGTDLRYLGSRFNPDPLSLICERSNYELCVEALIRHLKTVKKWDRLILDFFVEEEAQLWPCRHSRQATAPFLTLPGSFDALLASKGKKRRYKIRSALRMAEQRGLEMCEARNAEERHGYLAELYRLHRLRSTELGRTSSIDNEGFEKFLSHLVVSSDRARLFSLVHEGSAIAALLGFEANKTFYYYQISHDPAYAELGPGTILLAQVIQLACGRGLEEFNFLQGDETYKAYWTAEKRDLAKISCSSTRIRGLLMQAMRA